MLLEDFRRPGNAHAEISQEAIFNSINPAMHAHALLASPRVLNDAGLGHIENLLDDVQLAKPIDRLGLGGGAS